MDALRPKPFRGDVIAAGVVVLVTLVWVVATRFEQAWADGVHVAYGACALAFVLLLAVQAPMEGDAPRAYQSVLYVASVALFVDVVFWVARILAGDGDAVSPGALTWTLAAVAVFAVWFAIRRNSAVCTLIGALAGGGAVLAAVALVWHPHGFGTDRWVLLGLMVVYGFLAIGQRDRRLRHGVALIDAAGLSVAVIGGSFVADAFLRGLSDSGDEPIVGVAWGWELVILAAGFGLIAYSSVDRQPGPAYLGVLNLIFFAIITSLDVSAGSLPTSWKPDHNVGSTTNVRRAVPALRTVTRMARSVGVAFA